MVPPDGFHSFIHLLSNDLKTGAIDSTVLASGARGFRQIDDRYVDIDMAIDMAAEVGMERDRDNDWTLAKLRIR